MNFTPDSLGSSIRQTALNAAVDIPQLFNKSSDAISGRSAKFPEICMNSQAADGIAKLAVEIATKKTQSLTRKEGRPVADLDPISCAEIWIKSLIKWLDENENAFSKLFRVKTSNGKYQDATKQLLVPKFAAYALNTQAALVFIRISEVRTIAEVLADNDAWIKFQGIVAQSLVAEKPDVVLEKAVALLAETPQIAGAKTHNGSGPK